MPSGDGHSLSTRPRSQRSSYADIQRLRRSSSTANTNGGLLSPLSPTTEMMLDAMRRENEQLRARLVETERDYIRVTRLNEIYREELIEHRRRVCTSIYISSDHA